MNKRCGKCKKEFESMGVNDKWCTECCKAIPKDKWDAMEIKNAKEMSHQFIEPEDCPYCGKKLNSPN